MQPKYSTKATSTGGRDGRAVSEDKKIDLQLSVPKELGGDSGPGTNPEQLFAAGYSACFLGALKLVASQQKVTLPKETSITAEIGIGDNTKGEGFNISATLTVNAPDVDHEVLKPLVEKAHQVCPYSNATRGNVDVELICA
ncbi:MAG: organic hydroperoxide resistance protein [Pseudomonadota bacterium]|nr:organic hydroperoxide resistance protein [Gammaproteobacteria bacterium]MEC8009402.1 organic hydroperoxide resistance protein [Pseudomonadota bacterium]|tara:strand:- start:379 stop:801 length:423 start_codon:yes stop_codon:yes gene_type:complete